MKFYAALPLTLLAFVAGWLPSSPHDLTEDQRERIETQVSEFLASYVEALEGGETEAIRALYVTDERFAWFADGERRYTSADDVIAALTAMEGMSFSTESTELEVVPLTPDLAQARTAFHTKISQGGAVVYEFDGVTTWLLEGSKGDGWRVLSGHTSTPKGRD